MIELINGFGNLHKQIVGIKLKFTIRVGMRKKKLYEIKVYSMSSCNQKLNRKGRSDERDEKLV